MFIRKIFGLFLFAALLALTSGSGPAQAPAAQTVFGYANFAPEAKVESEFLAVPNPRAAGEDLKILTEAPHVAATPEDHKTALFVAQKFREAGLETEIDPFRVLINYPKAVRVEAYDPAGKLLMTGPTREHVKGDPYDNDPRIIMPFNSSSGSGDVTAGVVYANYGRLEDYNELAARHIDLHGKIVICRYGANFRGVKVYLAEQRGAVGVLIYSDPEDDGYYRGDPWPDGPWRPATGVQRGSVQYLFKYAGDPETPGFASTLDLPDSARKSMYGNQPHIISIPLSYHDAAPILEAMKGPSVPQGWQGALPFRYHIGAGGVKVHLVSDQDYERRIIWDVIGTVKGSEYPDAPVILGNHRDAWVFGAVDPSSGTAAMLEAARGVGALLKTGWRPKRTIVFCSWDAEEFGMMGSTEWVEQHEAMLRNAVAYFNVDVGVAGPNFTAEAVPSLQDFVRGVTKSVESPAGGTVYDQWWNSQPSSDESGGPNAPPGGMDVRVGVLGSGSDYTPFLDHVGVPSTDVSSDGPYGVYHSAFDDFAWFTRNADPHFLYLQEMARVFGLEGLRMADADVLPYDYATYARDIAAYIATAKGKAADDGLSLDFRPAEAAARRFEAAAQRVDGLQASATGNLAGLDKTRLNQALRETETALIAPAGLPGRPWYKHAIYAPGEYTGYTAVVIPGVNEAIDARDAGTAAEQLTVLTQALDRAAATLNAAP